MHTKKYVKEDHNNVKGREPEWPNPKLNVGNCLKSSKNGLKIIYFTLPSYLNFQKCEFSVSPKTHFNDVFKIRGANSTFVS